MKNLNQFQRQFKKAVIQESFPNPHHLKKLGIRNTPPISPQKRVEIYREDYQARLYQYLCKELPDFRKKLPSKVFDKLAHLFIAKSPSHHADLGELGRDFAQSLPKKYQKQAMIEWLSTEVKRDEFERAVSFLKREPKASDQLRWTRGVYLYKDTLIYRRQDRVVVEKLPKFLIPLVQKLFHGASLKTIVTLSKKNQTNVFSNLTKWAELGILTKK